MNGHIPGIQVSRAFHDNYIAPRLASCMSALPYASALVGPGSEVLGFDTSMSRDHDWGPRVLIFIRESDVLQQEKVLAALHKDAPAAFHGFPVHIEQTVVTTVPAYYSGRLGVCPSKVLEGLELLDWLTIPSQTLAELTGGAVFRDDIGELTAARGRLGYYPQDVWLFLMASVWNRIGQEEHLMPRAGFMEDELGAALIASRLLTDVMSLCFLIERRYAPYPKWFGTAFRQLACASELMPQLLAAQQAAAWREREQALAAAYRLVARLHNGLQLTEPLEVEPRLFFDRPFTVIGGGRFAEALISRIGEPALRKLSDFRFGGMDQISDNTDFRLLHQRFPRTPEGKSPLRVFFDHLMQGIGC
ncbi:DUF4037 domain-containing protein [Paenibacillus mucilaginosus]|uniref:DUF4037 domain-containing protein n=1 Tax=Paenibacillus mucilaginosus TaxID=61624 RepID=UPI0002FE5AF5|nr:DUF4037 domain-containing protein [Paenibacillus mucilaginosus]MCG7214392.1 DUF4037 domain-containing protein [Paenibacillus mucilaginosus]WDM30678.1 DUF4037 domain-containing protein [Paenibacillus mucilaginosus]